MVKLMTGNAGGAVLPQIRFGIARVTPIGGARILCHSPRVRPHLYGAVAWMQEMGSAADELC